MRLAEILNYLNAIQVNVEIALAGPEKRESALKEAHKLVTGLIEKIDGVGLQPVMSSEFLNSLNLVQVNIEIATTEPESLTPEQRSALKKAHEEVTTLIVHIDGV